MATKRRRRGRRVQPRVLFVVGAVLVAAAVTLLVVPDRHTPSASASFDSPDVSDADLRATSHAPVRSPRSRSPSTFRRARWRGTWTSAAVHRAAWSSSTGWTGRRPSCAASQWPRRDSWPTRSPRRSSNLRSSVSRRRRPAWSAREPDRRPRTHHRCARSRRSSLAVASTAHGPPGATCLDPVAKRRGIGLARATDRRRAAGRVRAGSGVEPPVPAGCTSTARGGGARRRRDSAGGCERQGRWVANDRAASGRRSRRFWSVLAAGRTGRPAARGGRADHRSRSRHRGAEPSASGAASPSRRATAPRRPPRRTRTSTGQRRTLAIPREHASSSTRSSDGWRRCGSSRPSPDEVGRRSPDRPARG